MVDWRTLLRFLPEVEPWRSLAREAIFLVVIFAAVFLLERLYRRDLSRYRSRSFLNDLVYSFFYQGGLYNLLIYVPIFSVLQEYFSFASLNVLAGLPGGLAFICYWLCADFLGYWIHRLQHHAPFLWAFHSIHHAPEKITFATSSRNHLIDQVIANSIMFIPVLVLGVPRTIWIPFFIAHALLESLQHAELQWKYGPLYRVVVSPLFHNLHHSADSREYNGNYSKILSVWDFLFGTAVTRDHLPSRYGIEGTTVPETLTGQFLAPFRLLAARRSAPDQVPSVPEITRG